MPTKNSTNICQCHQTQHTPQAIGKDNFYLEAEFKSLKPDDKDKYFIIGSTRAPCDWYLSLWAFLNKGLYYQKHPKLTEFHGVTPPYTNDEDLMRFSKWLNASRGLLSRRFEESYGIEGKPASRDSVDCWVDTASMATDLQVCLEQYEKQAFRGGALVAWDRYFAYVDAPTKREENVSVHGSCREMFDDARTAMVVKAERNFMKIMGYKSCCAQLVNAYLASINCDKYTCRVLYSSLLSL